MIFASVAAGGVLFTPEVVVRNDILYLGDVADVSALPINIRNRAEKLPLMRLPENRSPVMLDVSDIAARARSLIPALAPWFQKSVGTVSILRRRDDPMRLMANATQDNSIAKDERVRVTIVAGIYTVERQGIAMSNAKAGERLFVKTENRKVLSVTCCGE